MDDVFVKIKGGDSVCVPRSPQYLTTFVVLEQEDWFEKEIGFVRRLLRPGMRALDVGANYGLYTMAMSRGVGPTGAIWAFEPATATADHLRKTIDRNALSQVSLCRLALSDHEGTARLRLLANSELNSLSGGDDGPAEDVALSTLDRQQDAARWGNIDFVKLDAEGEEERILRGGERFFAEQSPLVMFEIKHGAELELGIATGLVERGYGLYRLVGPNRLLVPVISTETIDAYELNLFAAKPDRAKLLAASAQLATSPTSIIEPPAGIGIALWRRQRFARSFAKLPVVRDAGYERALDAYAVWRDVARSVNERSGALFASLDLMKAAVAMKGSLARLSSYGRIAYEAGRHGEAVVAVEQMMQRLQGAPEPFDEPFWPLAARYDNLNPRGRVNDWFAASVVESLDRWRALTGYFAPPDILSALDWLQSTPFASAQSERRRRLMGLRTGRPTVVAAGDILAHRSADNLNPELWRGGTSNVEDWVRPR